MITAIRLNQYKNKKNFLIDVSLIPNSLTIEQYTKTIEFYKQAIKLLINSYRQDLNTVYEG